MSLTESALSSEPSNPASGSSGWEKAGRRLGGVLYILLCVETGVFLLVLPWSAIWERSFLLRYYPLLRPIYLSAYLRGAISGLGLVNLWLGVSQAWLHRRAAARPPGGN
jgi:hypothetical protein